METVDVFDSNVWILGFTESAPRPRTLVEEAIDGERVVALDAYIYQEVFDAFERQLSGRLHDRVKANFAEVVADSDSIVMPDPARVEDVHVEAVREETEIQLVARLLDCQPKDAPVVVLAYEYREDGAIDRRQAAVVHTTDDDFASSVERTPELPLIDARRVPQ